MTTGSPSAASTSSMNGSRRRSGSLHRAGDAIVAGAVPLAYWHTSVRYRVLMRGVPASGGPGAPTPAPASSAITRESCPPCQAIGERAGGLGLLDDQLRARDRRAHSSRRRASGCPGSASSRLATRDRGDGDRGELGPILERARARHGLQRVGDRAGCSCAAGAGAGRSRRSREWSRAALQVIRGDEALPPALAQSRAPARPIWQDSASPGPAGGVEGRRDDRQRGRPRRG